jgi:hypothetical protein
MTASTGLSHPSGQCAGLPTRRVPFSTTTPFNHGREVPESAGLRPANYGEKHCRQSAKWGKAGPPGPAASTTQTRRLVATGSGDKPQLRCLVVRYARVRFLHLHGSPDALASRIGARTDHFMPSLAADVPNGNFRAADSRRGRRKRRYRGHSHRDCATCPAGPRPHTADCFALGPMDDGTIRELDRCESFLARLPRR